MTVFKSFFSVARAYIQPMLIYVGIVLGMAVILTGSGANSDKFSAKRYDIIVVDNDGSQLSALLVDYLGSIHDIKKGSFDEDKIRDMLYYEAIVEYVEIPKGFSEAFFGEGEAALKCMKDDAMPMGVFVERQADDYLLTLKECMTLDGDILRADERTRELLRADESVRLISREQIDERLYNYYLFLPYGVICILLSGILPVFAAFNDEERRKRMMASPMSVSKRDFILQAAAALMALVVFLLFVVISFIFSGSELFKQSWFLCVLNLFIFTLVTVAMLRFIICFPIKQGAQISMITNILGLSMAFLGGVFVPLSVLGEGTKKIGRFLPTYWYANTIEQLKNGSPAGDAVLSMLIELIFIPVFMLAALIAGRRSERA